MPTNDTIVTPGPTNPADKLKARAWFAKLSPEEQAELAAEYAAMHNDVANLTGKHKAERARADRYHDMMTQDDPSYGALLAERTNELEMKHQEAEAALKAAQAELDGLRGRGPELEAAKQQLAEARAQVAELNELHERYRKWADEVVYPTVEADARTLADVHGQMDLLYDGLSDALRYALHRADPEVASMPDAVDELVKDIVAAQADFDPKDPVARYGKLDNVMTGFVARRKPAKPESNRKLPAQLDMQQGGGDRPQFTGSPDGGADSEFMRKIGRLYELRDSLRHP